MARIDDLRSELNKLATDLKTLEGWSAADDLTDEQRSEIDTDLGAKLERWDAVKAEYDPLEDRSNRLAKVGEIRSSTSPTREAGSDSFNINRGDRTDNIYDLTELRSLDGTAYRTEITSRAMRAVEQGDFPDASEYGAGITDEGLRESAERHIRRSPKVAEHILRTGNPAYVSAFQKHIKNPVAGLALLSEEEKRAWADVEAFRAFNEGTTAAGGALVPPFLDPTIILTNVGTTNPFRQIATVKTIATQTWKGVTTAGVTAEWTAEAAEATDATPSDFANPTITPVRADAYLQASFESVEDTNFATDVGMLIADARDRLESKAFAVGTGSTQPNGIVTKLQTVTASRVAATTNGSFGAVDVFALDNALGPRWRANGSFLANKSIYNLVRQMATGSGFQSGSFWVDFGGGHPAHLIGYPVYESSEMFNAPLSTATASNDDVMVLGDFRQYYVVDRIGMAVTYNPLVIGSNRRPTGEVGWFAFWRVGGDCVVADAFRMLRV